MKNLLSTKNKRDHLGANAWAIAEGYIPAEGNETNPTLKSHETACILNANNEDANVKITIYFSDREPVGPYEIVIPARRTKHIRFNELTNPMPLPREKDYSSVIESDLPIVVQHTRLDSRTAKIALLSTVAYAQSA